MDSCIFCSIVRGETEALSMYEDDLVKVMADKNPAAVGHSLVMPKAHYENIYEIPERELERVAVVAKRVATVYKEHLKADGINLVQANGAAAGQSVFHFHLHVIPRYRSDGYGIAYGFHGDHKRWEESSKALLKIRKYLQSFD